LLHPALLRDKLRLCAERLVLAAREFDSNAAISPDVLRETLQRYSRAAQLIRVVGPGYLAERLQQSGDVLFEGAQGVLLDESYGFYPHVTWTDTTTRNALALLEEAGYQGRIRRLGVLRTYATRHGAGPFVTEDSALHQRLREVHNTAYEWAGALRFGHFDVVATRYALEATGGVDALAITHLDDLPVLAPLRICRSYLLDGCRVSRLALPKYPVDLGAQSALTARLAPAQPEYTSLA
jgi:adenylosuccinate synthase